ncbi:MAG: hypothetical protein BGO95_11715 [Micrococcales bacterium 73-13]|nr:MAG: hypothetical protein BGO95_11715 [Micrococcales bacterium 73-13]
MSGDAGAGAGAPVRRFRLPWWISLIGGAAVVVLGLLLIVRPFASIGALVVLIGAAAVLAGVVEAVRAALPGLRVWWRVVLAVLLLATGVLVLAWPGLTIRMLVTIVGIALLAVGAVGLVRSVWSGGSPVSPGTRVAEALNGVTGVVLGVVALTWPDVTVLAVGVIFGAWLIYAGVRIAILAVLARPGRRPRERASRRRHEWPKVVGALLGCLATIAVALVGLRLSGSPVPDAFYAVPGRVPDQPGQLIRAEPFTNAIPDDARAWRILYTTTREDGVPAVASGLVMVPNGVADPPTIAWTHGTTGAAVGCAPSLAPEPFTVGAMPDWREALARGWAIVATDYVGLGVDPPHPYVVGQPEARSALDAVRASRQLDGASFGEQVVVWGHSQGGHAALWTGGLAAEYAPELDIVGVAAMAPASNLPALVGSFANSEIGTVIGPLVIEGYAGAYPDVRVEDYVIPQARILVEEIASRCWSEPSMVVGLVEAGLIDRPIWSRDPGTGPLAARAEQNVPRLPIAAPLLIAQGLADPLILPTSQQDYVDSLCAAGQQVDYRTYPGKDHMGVVTGDSPLLGELLDWTQDRLDGRPPLDTC